MFPHAAQRAAVRHFHRHLVSVRPEYLGLRVPGADRPPLTERECATVDERVAAFLRTHAAAVQALAAAEGEQGPGGPRAADDGGAVDAAEGGHWRVHTLGVRLFLTEQLARLERYHARLRQARLQDALARRALASTNPVPVPAAAAARALPPPPVATGCARAWDPCACLPALTGGGQGGDDDRRRLYRNGAAAVCAGAPGLRARAQHARVRSQVRCHRLAAAYGCIYRALTGGVGVGYRELERKVLEIGRLEDILTTHIERQAQQVRGPSAPRWHRTHPLTLGARMQIEHLYDEACRCVGPKRLGPFPSCLCALKLMRTCVCVCVCVWYHPARRAVSATATRTCCGPSRRARWCGGM
jgi:hypothetical protein